MASFGDLNRVNTNIQSQDSQLSLNRINKSLSENQMRLSTGLRINRAEDDAAGFSIATKLNSRVAGLEQAMSNVGDAKSVLDIAESSFDQTMDSLIEMKSLATQAANDTLGSEERGFIADKIESLGSDINEVANQTVFQDFELLNGAADQNFSGSLSMTFQVGERGTDTITTDIAAVNVNELFTGSSGLDTEITAGAVGELDIAAASIAGTATGGVSEVTIGTDTVSFTSFTGTATSTELGNIVSAINTADIEGVSATLNGSTIEIDNATANDIDIAFDDPNNYTSTLSGGTETALTGQGALDLSNFGADEYRTFISDIDSAISSMSQRVNEIGIAQSSLSVREVTLSQSISANSSAVSRIMDADFAKEQSESVRLQILQQTATSALAQANMGPQSVLGFLG